MLCSHKHQDAAQGRHGSSRKPTTQTGRVRGAPHSPVGVRRGHDFITHEPLCALSLSSGAGSQEVKTRRWCEISRWRPFSTRVRPSRARVHYRRQPACPAREPPATAVSAQTFCGSKSHVAWMQLQGHLRTKMPANSAQAGSATAPSALSEPRGEGQTSAWELETRCFQKGSCRPAWKQVRRHQVRQTLRASGLARG